MKRLLIYADASVVGGCEDPEFAADIELGYPALEIRTPREVLRYE